MVIGTKTHNFYPNKKCSESNLLFGQNVSVIFFVFGIVGDGARGRVPSSIAFYVTMKNSSK